MCRIEEKVYIGSDGRNRTFQDTFECDRARRRGKRCSKPEKRTREYIGAPPIARDDASSPASINPPTPTGPGSYLVEERRPSGSGRRPSLKPSSVKPEIIIQIGGSRKDKDKKYPRTYVSKNYKRSSLGASSTTSNEMAVESPGSDASYPIRTGLPETAVPHAAPFGQSHGYTTRHVVPQGHRHTLSASSVTTSQTPSLYTTSETEPESPSGYHAPEYPYPRTIVHNTRPAPSSPVTSRGHAVQSSAYRPRLEVPHSSSRDTSSSRDNMGDYSDVVDLYASSNGSNASSSRAAAPEITDRAIDRERRRKRQEEEKKREEEEERRLDEEHSKATEQAKQVRFAELETGRYEERDRLRKEQKYAESEKHRAEEREKERQRKEQEKRATKEPEKRATKKPEREKTQPPTRDFNKKQSGGRHSRRNSMTQADVDQLNHLLLQEKLQMSLEREAAEQREREEHAAELRQQQFSIRTSNTSMETHFSAPPTRPQLHSSTQSYHAEEPRPPVSSGKHGSISMNPSPVGHLGRTNITHGPSIIQPNPPVLTPLTTSFPQQQSYSTRPPSSHTTTQPYTTREQFPSARYSPSQLSGPFGQPTTRTSNTSMENNPFAAPSDRPIHPVLPPVPVAHHYPPVATNDVWDTRGMQTALPSYPAGQPAQYAAQGHGRAQQATRNMNQAYGTHVEDEWR